MSPEITILLVEDEPQLLRIVRSVLEGEGYRVFDADTGRRGLIEAGTRKPDLLIVDLGLPDMDGADLVREFRTWSDAAVLILSARTEEPAEGEKRKGYSRINESLCVGCRTCFAMCKFGAIQEAS